MSFNGTHPDDYVPPNTVRLYRLRACRECLYISRCMSSHDKLSFEGICTRCGLPREYRKRVQKTRFNHNGYKYGSNMGPSR